MKPLILFLSSLGRSLVILPFLATGSPAEMMSVSWYGPGFQGNYTSSGEVFDRWGHTAAHPSWPFGTQLRLTNPSNGQWVDVHVNDRSQAGLDLSEQAAKDLGIHLQGIATVDVEVLQWGQ